MSVFIFKSGFQRMEEDAGRSTQRVLPWHRKGSEYLKDAAEDLEMVMCD
jgi:hypothetical protein